MVTVDYQLFFQESFSQTFRTGNYASGMGKDFGPWYDVCSGPPLTGYALSNQSFDMSGDDGRGCLSWGKCESPSKAADGGACARFQLQGKEAKFPDAMEVKHGSATLRVTWSLIRSEPRLLQVPSKN